MGNTMNFKKFLHRFNQGKKELKVKPSLQEMIRTCPICYSTYLYPKPNRFVGLLAPLNYFCKECGYLGLIYAEVEPTQLKDIQIEVRNNLLKRPIMEIE